MIPPAQQCAASPNRDALSDSLGIWLVDGTGETRGLIAPPCPRMDDEDEARLLAHALLQCAGGYVLTARWSRTPVGRPDIAEIDRGEIDRVRHLRRIAAALGAPLLDHIVLNPAGHFSLREHGLM